MVLSTQTTNLFLKSWFYRRSIPIYFRKHVFKDIVNNYNDEVFKGIGRMGYLSMIVGYDFYHYSDNFWLFSVLEDQDDSEYF